MNDEIKLYIKQQLNEKKSMSDIGNYFANLMSEAFTEWQNERAKNLDFEELREQIIAYQKKYYPQLTTTELTESKLIDSLTEKNIYKSACAKGVASADHDAIQEFLKEYRLL